MVFDTKSLVYDLDKHKYFATPQGVLERFNVSLKKELGEETASGVTEENVFIRQASDRVYRWIWAYIKPESKRIIEKWIADNKTLFGDPFREALEEAIYSQIEYMINFDGDMQAQASGDINKLVSIEAQNILIDSGIAFSGYIQETVSSDEWRVGY